VPVKSVDRKIFRGRPTEKRSKNSKKDRKIALLRLSPGEEGQRKKERKIAKKAENSTIKPLFTISVPCMKIQGGHAPLCPPFPTPMVRVHILAIYHW